MSNGTQQSAYGQLTPEDVTSDLDMMNFVVRQVLNQVDTVKVVKVIAVHPGSGSPPAGGTVDVQPLVNQIDGNGFPTSHGTVFGLPYTRMQAGAWAIIADPAVGDMGLIVCADRDSSSVIANKAQANPGSRRKHNIADGFYIGAALNAAPTSYFQLNSDGTFKIADSKGNVLQTSGSGFSLTGNVVVTGNFSASGTISDTSGAGLSLTTHTHSGVTTGGGTSGPPTPGT
jgi:hypothetical protein